MQRPWTIHEQTCLVVSSFASLRGHLVLPEGERPMEPNESGEFSPATAGWSLVRVGIRVLEGRSVLRNGDPRPLFADFLISQEAGIRRHQGELAGNEVDDGLFR